MRLHTISTGDRLGKLAVSEYGAKGKAEIIAVAQAIYDHNKINSPKAVGANFNIIIRGRELQLPELARLMGTAEIDSGGRDPTRAATGIAPLGDVGGVAVTGPRAPVEALPVVAPPQVADQSDLPFVIARADDRTLSSLSAIAKKYGHATSTVIALNKTNIPVPSKMPVGAKVYLPASTEVQAAEAEPLPPISDLPVYTIRRNESLYGVADRYGIPRAEVVRLNKPRLEALGRSIHDLAVGYKMVLPQPPKINFEITREDLVDQPPEITAAYEIFTALATEPWLVSRLNLKLGTGYREGDTGSNNQTIGLPELIKLSQHAAARELPLTVAGLQPLKNREGITEDGIGARTATALATALLKRDRGGGIPRLPARHPIAFKSPLTLRKGEKAAKLGGRRKRRLDGDPGGTSNLARYHQFARKYAQEFNLPPELVIAVIEQESYWNPNVKSSRGAVGLMQLMPDTARALGVSDPTDPEQNIRGGCQYLAYIANYLVRSTNLKPPVSAEAILAGYNAGPTRPRNRIKAGKHPVPNFSETRKYVRNITAMVEYLGK